MKSVFTILLIFPLISACSDDNSRYLDIKYSGYLTAMASTYRAKSKESINQSVSSIQIYLSSERNYDFKGLHDLDSKKQVFESSNMEVIDKILTSAQADLNSKTTCYINEKSNLYYIISYDHSMLKYGLFFAQECSNENNEYFKITYYQPDGSLGSYNSKELLDSFRSNGVI